MTSSPVFHSAGALFGQSLSTRANDLRLKKVNALALSISNMVSESLRFQIWFLNKSPNFEKKMPCWWTCWALEITHTAKWGKPRTPYAYESYRFSSKWPILLKLSEFWRKNFFEIFLVFDKFDLILESRLLFLAFRNRIFVLCTVL